MRRAGDRAAQRATARSDRGERPGISPMAAAGSSACTCTGVADGAEPESGHRRPDRRRHRPRQPDARPGWPNSATSARPEDKVKIDLAYTTRLFQARLRPVWHGTCRSTRWPGRTIRAARSSPGWTKRSRCFSLTGILGDHPPRDDEGFLEFIQVAGDPGDLPDGEGIGAARRRGDLPRAGQRAPALRQSSPASRTASWSSATGSCASTRCTGRA